MKKIIVFETTKELLDAFKPIRPHEDYEGAFIPYPIKLIFRFAAGVELEGEGSDAFVIEDHNITINDVILELASRAGIPLEIR